MRITRSLPNRVYVTDPRDWGIKLGTDYIWAPTSTTNLTQATGTPFTGLVDHGWVTTSVAFATSTGADFLATDAAWTHNGVLMDASGDILRSPQIFGDYNHARAVQDILGYFPTSLNLDVGATWTVASADESQTAFGFLEAGGTASVANDHMASIYSNATTFLGRSAADSDAGAAVDNAYHVFGLRLTPGTTDKVQWFIDGVSQGTFDLQTDLFPVSFFAHALTTNRFNLGYIHIWYA